MANRAADMSRLIRKLQSNLRYAEYYDRARIIMLDIFEQYGRDMTAEEYQSLLQSPLSAAVTSLITQVYMDWQTAAQTVNDLYSDLGMDISRQSPVIRATEQILLADIGDYEKQTLAAIARQFRAASVARETRDQLAARLLSHIDGKAKSYAVTIARTLIKSHSRAMVAEKARVADCRYFAYTGPAVWTTGPRLSHVFCVSIMRYQQRHFHRSEIDKMRNGQMEPVLIHCGGWRCRHTWEPDPFYNPEKHSVYFVDVMDGKRIVKIARHKNADPAKNWEIKKD